MVTRTKALALPAPAALASKPARRYRWWLYGYGAFQGSASVVDSYTLFFAAAILSAGVTTVSLVDALGSVGYTVGIGCIALLTPRFTEHRALLVVLLGTASLPLFLFPSITSPAIFIGVTLAFGLLWGPVSALGPIVSIQNVDRSMWGRIFAQLNEYSALGGVAALAFAAVWMIVVQRVGDVADGSRTLFIVLGSVTLASAFLVQRSLSAPPPSKVRLAQPDRIMAGLRSGGGARAGFMSDQLFWFYLLSFVMFVGLGMSFSGLHVYMVSDMRLPIAAGIMAILGFKLAMYVTSRAVGDKIGRVAPLQVQSLAALARAVLVALLALLGFLPPSSMSFVAVLAVVSSWGAISAVMSVTGLLVATNMAPQQRKNGAIAIYLAIINGATIMGAWVAGAIGGSLGFDPMFLISGALAAGAALLLLRI